MNTALSLIHQAYEEGWEELDLSGMELTELPPEIGKLVQLRRLILGKWDAVKSDGIGNLLTQLPHELWELQQLEKLDVSYNQISVVPDLIGNLVNLTELSLWQNQISVIPDSVGNLVNLTMLAVGRNSISVFPDSIMNLIKLTSLDLQDNKIHTIPDSISKLVNLERLYLAKNQISLIPDSVTGLTKLTRLDLQRNLIHEIPDSASRLVKLTGLFLDRNLISVIPDSIVNLVNLKLIFLSYNQISEIPDWIDSLINLTHLYLVDNKITKIPEPISNLVNLTNLYLGSNQITEIPDSIGKLRNLTNLYFWGNQVTEIPDSTSHLVNLIELHIGNNQIREIPTSIEQLANLKKLDLSGNPISIPSEILESSNPKPILDYYFTTRDPNQTQDIYEAKLLIVGEGGSGKTSLANKLINPDYDLKPETEDISTEGIDILDWEFTGTNGKDYKIHIWDFGGQEIYHQTHQFFLTDRACYLLVADDRKENTDHYYWLQSIQLLGKTSPIHLIQNERGDRTCTLNTNQLRGEFETLRQTHRTNLKDNRGLDTLKLALQHEIETLLPHGIPFPNKWLNVRHTLENDSRNYIDTTDYEATCRRHDITDKSEMTTLSRFLHDLGIILHFQHDPILRHRLILKPNWGTTAVYKILDNPTVKTNLGQFTDRDLAEIWSDRTYADMHHELLQLMKEFKVCYEIPRRPGHYIAPHLLSPDSPTYDWNPNSNLILRYHYNHFMPKGILTRFIVEMHRDIENVNEPNRAHVWKNGVIITHRSARAEIIEHYPKREIHIRVSGNRPRDLLTIVNRQFEDIHDHFYKDPNPEKPPYDTLIPCNCPTCKPSTAPFTFTLDRLHTCLDRNRYTIECHESGEDVQVRGLIDGVIQEDPEDFEDSFEDYSGKRDRHRVSRRRFNSTPATPTINIYNTNQQEQDMSNDKIWNGDRIQGNKYEANNSTNSMIGENISGDNVSGTKIINSQNLTQAAKEIKDLLDEISATDTTNNQTLIAMKAIEAIEKNPTLKERIINAGKEAGFAAIDAAVEHPAVKIVTAAIKGAIEA